MLLKLRGQSPQDVTFRRMLDLEFSPVVVRAVLMQKLEEYKGLVLGEIYNH